MDRLAIRFMGEWYIQDGFTDLRNHLGEPIENEPKFIKTTLEEIKQEGGDIQYRQLINGCILDEIGFSAPRIGPTEFGEKTIFYGINAPSERHERERAMNDVAKVFADKFRQYAKGTKKGKPRAAKDMNS